MRLRPLCLKDAPLMLEWMRDENVSGVFLQDFSHMELRDCERFVEESLTDGENLHRCVADEADSYMGTVSLKHIDRVRGSAEFAIVLRSCAMGKGYGAFALREIQSIGFGELGLQAIYWCVRRDNARAMRFYRKNRCQIAGAVPNYVLQRYSREELGELEWFVAERGSWHGEDSAYHRDANIPQEVIPANPKAKDTFFKKVYESEERQRDLASFLLGIAPERVRTANVRPVLFGNKENDFACLCDGVVYMMMEAQSSPSPNIAYRMAEYAIAGLRSLVESERALYGGARVMFPVPKLYVTQTGIEERREHLPKDILTDMSLSDSYYSTRGSYGKEIPPDMQVTVHAYDFRMTPYEIKAYIEQNAIPGRFDGHGGDLMDYALVANGMTYMQGAIRRGRYEMPENVSTVAEFLQLEADRGIFVDLLTDKEVCDMTMAEFSRDDIIRYQGIEEGLERGREEGLERGREEGLERGREEGREEGREDGADRMAALCSTLITANRADDILRATQDKGYRENLFKEFGLSYPAAGKG